MPLCSDALGKLPQVASNLVEFSHHNGSGGEPPSPKADSILLSVPSEEENRPLWRLMADYFSVRMGERGTIPGYW